MKSTDSNVLRCHRSGVALLVVQTVSAGSWPIVGKLQADLMHPVYDQGLDSLLVTYKLQLTEFEAVGWMLDSKQFERLALTMSATMYQLGCIWLPPKEAVHLWKALVPSLPSEVVVTATASRLFNLAKWYHYATSKRLDFPKYRVSKSNNNLAWDNFSAWLDDAFSVRDEWESGRKTLEREEEMRVRTAALETIKSEAVYKKIDFKKVWNWIDIQLSINPSYPAGRRETFKTIFMTADQHPEQWLMDDVEDLQHAILECCDLGNDISFFINERLRSIRSLIKDFYSGFTLLSDVKDAVGSPEQAAREVAATNALFAEYDKQLDELQELPPEPQRASYSSLAKFMQASAQWRLLSKRHKERTAKANSNNASNASNVNNVNVGEL